MFNKGYTNQIWYLYIALIVLEFALFTFYIKHTLEGFYPVSFDQADYLQLSYRLFESIRANGFFYALSHSNLLHNGILFPLQAVFFFLIFGATRFSALLPNLIYFILLQFFIVFTLRSLNKKNYLAILFLGLLLSVKTPLLSVGSLLDFRMDFIAFCLYGIFVCAVIRADFFLDRKWSMMAGLIAAVLILSRFITLTYIFALFTFMGIYFLMTCRQIENKHRLQHLLLAAGTISLFLLPYLWLSRVSIYNYYMSTHILGSEKYIRLSEVGVTTVLSYLWFYPASLLFDHLGLKTLLYALLILGIYLFFFFSSSHLVVKKSGMNQREAWVFLLFSLILPLLILTTDISKSSIVGSITVVPALWLIFWLYLSLDEKIHFTQNKKRLFGCLAMLIFLSGLYHHTHKLLHTYGKPYQQNLQTITKMYQDIGDYALAKGWVEIGLSVDQIRDYLTASSLTTVYYETRHTLLNAAIQKMGGTIFALNEADVLASLEKSNVVILNLNDYKSRSPYPFNHAMNALKPFIVEQVKLRHFQILGDYPVEQAIFRVYVAT